MRVPYNERRVRRTLATTRRFVLGPRPLRAGAIVATAAGTAALQSAGFDEWWALPLGLLAALIASRRLRRAG